MSEGIDRYFGKEAPLIEPSVFPDWILRNDDSVLVINKPGWLVCHPSKAGPWSSLVGAVREHFGFEKIHMISRLDRETSGLVVFAKHRMMASRLQTAFSDRRTDKTYHAILKGRLDREETVEGNLVDDKSSKVVVQQKMTYGNAGKYSKTIFKPIEVKGNLTMAEIYPETGRKHQIRVHAAELGMPILGDKIYGGDPSCYLEFIKEGWTDRLEQVLGFPRQALHASGLKVWGEDWVEEFSAPMAEDMVDWWNGV